MDIVPKLDTGLSQSFYHRHSTHFTVDGKRPGETPESEREGDRETEREQRC